MNIKKILCSLSLALFGFLLTSCGDGPNSANGNGNVAPSGLNGLEMTLSSGAKMEFIADIVQSTTGIETGTISYDQNGASEDTFFNIAGSSTTFTWPETFIFTRYTYQAVGVSSGILSIWGTPTDTDPAPLFLPVVFDGTSEATPAEMTLLFQEAGGTISSVEAILDIISSSFIYTGTFAASITKVDGGAVPSGFIPDPSEFSALNDGQFNGDYIELTDNATAAEFSYIFAGSVPLSPTSSTSEEGTATITDQATADVIEAEYTNTPVDDTNIVTIALVFTGSSTGVIPTDVSYDLTFTSAEGGTYVGTDGSTGTFTFFNTGDL